MCQKTVNETHAATKREESVTNMNTVVGVSSQFDLEQRESNQQNYSTSGRVRTDMYTVYQKKTRHGARDRYIQWC